MRALYKIKGSSYVADIMNRLYSYDCSYIEKALEKVRERDTLQNDISSMKSQQKKLERRISVEEKKIADEINTTIRKRRLEIEGSYDDRLEENRTRKKTVANNRNKKKNQRINKRIEEETKDVRSDNRRLENEMKLLLKKNRTPSFCKSKLFFIMFNPKGLDEIIAMLVAFTIYFAGIPAGVMLLFKNLLLKDNKSTPIWSVVIVCVMVIIQLVIYFAIFSATKSQHKDVIDQARSIRDKMKANKRQINAIKSSIHKDNDEKQYNLDAYDDKLDKLNKEAEQLGQEKQEALSLFENETKQVIIDEINGRRLQAVEDMKAEKQNFEYNITGLEAQYNEKCQIISQNFAEVIGEDMCKADKISSLISLMEEGQANSVTEAIALVKK